MAKSDNYKIGPIEMEPSFVYTFIPLFALVLVVSYLKNKELKAEAAKRAAEPPTYSLWVPNAKSQSEESASTTSTESKPRLTFHQEPITAIRNFDLHATTPEPHRPYKPIYHMTMGLQTCIPNDLIVLDSSYPSRIALRKQLVADYPTVTMGVNPDATPAVNELYRYLLSVHLPRRFPTYFKADKVAKTFINNVSSDIYPLDPPESPLDALRILAGTVEDDILFLEKPAGQEEYRLRAFVACFPSGFDSSYKMGMTLREIHGPVPMYKEKLAFSMDRFFNKLEVGRWVRRFNWTITTHDRLFVPSGNHLYVDEDVPDELESVDLDKVFLRVERQVLLRLPESNAIVFFIKTYMTPLSEVKNEGQGEALAAAIEGIPESLQLYKKVVVWGKAVKAALRA